MWFNFLLVELNRTFKALYHDWYFTFFVRSMNIYIPCRQHGLMVEGRYCNKYQILLMTLVFSSGRLSCSIWTRLSLFSLAIFRVRSNICLVPVMTSRRSQNIIMFPNSCMPYYVSRYIYAVHTALFVLIFFRFIFIPPHLHIYVATCLERVRCYKRSSRCSPFISIGSHLETIVNSRGLYCSALILKREYSSWTLMHIETQWI